MLTTRWFRTGAYTPEKRARIVETIESLFAMNRELQNKIDSAEVTISVNNRQISELTLALGIFSGECNGSDGCRETSAP